MRAEDSGNTAELLSLLPCRWTADHLGNYVLRGR